MISDHAPDAETVPIDVRLNFIFLLAVLVAIAGIQTAALVLQFGRGELPCPLCLLERVALFGVCGGILFSLRHGFSYRNTGLSLLFSVFLLVVAARQSLLDIYPRPGHAYIGSPILGVHMPVWSILIALTLLAAYAAKLAVLGGDEKLVRSDVLRLPRLRRAGEVVGAYVIALCLINLVAVILQCGLGECHTTGYRLLAAP